MFCSCHIAKLKAKNVLKNKTVEENFWHCLRKLFTRRLAFKSYLGADEAGTIQEKYMVESRKPRKLD